MSQDLKAIIADKSDAELLRMVKHDFADYRREALDLAREELNRRGIAADELEGKIPRETYEGLVTKTRTDGASKGKFVTGIVLLVIWVIISSLMLVVAATAPLTPRSGLIRSDHVNAALTTVAMLAFILVIPGILLTYLGYQSNKRERIISNAIRMLFEDGFIDAHELAGVVNASDEETVKILNTAKGKGEIPADVEIRSLTAERL